MTRNKTKIAQHILYLIIAYSFVECQGLPYQPYARKVKFSKSGGTIALKVDHKDEDRMKADPLIVS